MPTLPTAPSITGCHDAALGGPPGPEGDTPLWRAIMSNHRYNTLLWNEEDQARRTDVPATAIAASKRRIDQHNQRRNDAVEAIDAALLAQLSACCAEPSAQARLSSETAGAMIDRLSILALKIHHMRQQSLRAEAGPAHMDACAAKLDRLIAQRADLGACLDRLLSESAAGSAYFKVYHQYKMYNDPALNPCLYGHPGVTRGPA